MRGRVLFIGSVRFACVAVLGWENGVAARSLLDFRNQFLADGKINSGSNGTVIGKWRPNQIAMIDFEFARDPDVVDGQQWHRLRPGFRKAAAAGFKRLIQMLAERLKIGRLQGGVEIAHHNELLLRMGANELLQRLKNNRTRAHRIRVDIDQQQRELFAAQCDFEQVIVAPPIQRATLLRNDFTLCHDQHLLAQKGNLVIREGSLPLALMSLLNAGFDKPDNIGIILADKLDLLVGIFVVCGVAKKSLTWPAACVAELTERLCTGHATRHTLANASVTFASRFCLFS